MVKRHFLIQWDSTNECNLRCSHCYHRNRKENPTLLKNPEMSFEEVIQMLKDLKKVSSDWSLEPRFHISGGEPLLRGDLINILDYSMGEGITTRLLTNGTLITPEKARAIYKKGVKSIQISIDGTEERHNKIRGRSYAYADAIKGIENSASEGIIVTASMTAMKSNKDDFEEVIKNSMLAGARIVGFQSYVPNPSLGSSDPEFLDAQETYELFMKTKELARKYRDRIHVLQTEVLWQILQEDSELKELSRRELKYLGGCSAGYFSLSVLASGDVYPCRRLPIIIGHIREGIKKIVLESEVMKDLRDLSKLKEKTLCDKVTHCRGCRAVAYAVSGDYMAKDPMCFKDLLT
jgi:AdoMet-dependent heme synthase